MAPVLTVTSGPSSIHPGQSAVYTISADKAAVQNIVIGYAMSGQATPGLDYTLSGNLGQLVIAPGQKAVTVTLTATANSLKKGAQTATMTLKPGTGYSFGSTSSSATVTISN
jgi:hypothetical protein